MNSKAYPRCAGLAIGVGIVSVLALASSAKASCISSEPYPRAIENAPAVFVGEVVDVTGRGRWATVEIREVWTGDDLPARVEVRGGPRGENVATSADRHFKLSGEYLFVPYDRKGSAFLDNACTRTTTFRPELARFRPTSATANPRAPETSSPGLDENTDVSGWLLAGVVMVGVGMLALVMLRRR